MPTAQTGKSRTTGKTPPTTVTSRSKKAPVAPAPAAKVSKAKKPSPAIAEDTWREMVATAAYYRAQARGFQPGSHDQDWLAAEADLKKRLGKT
jgi:BRCT domain type II-containing protein